MTSGSTSLKIIREMQLTTTVKYHLTLENGSRRMAIMKKKQQKNVGEDVGNREHLWRCTYYGR